MSIQDYVSKINARYASGISTEHSYRGDLQNLLESLAPDVMVTNEAIMKNFGNATPTFELKLKGTKR